MTTLTLSDMLAMVGNGEDLSWQDSAPCAESDPEAWFPEKGGTAVPAKRICARCEVKEECLRYALEHEIQFGVWGGLSSDERRPLLGLVPKNSRAAGRRGGLGEVA
jgi:WhiB family redox-sensing transcriptional regulator